MAAFEIMKWFLITGVYESLSWKKSELRCVQDIKFYWIFGELVNESSLFQICLTGSDAAIYLKVNDLLEYTRAIRNRFKRIPLRLWMVYNRNGKHNLDYKGLGKSS